MDENNKTIAIGTHKYPYKVPLNLGQLSIYLQYIIPNSKREMKEVFGKFDLDSASRRRQLNTIDFKTDAGERMKLQNINKGLTMELFASGMFGYFDHPSEVHSNCVVNRYQPQGAVGDSQYIAVPNNFAQGGVPDVQIDYTNFMVMLEVSGKEKPTLEHFSNQFNGALKHARAIRENGYDKPIYCLVIHERSLMETKNKTALKEVLEVINPSEHIYITAISILEFADLGHKMSGTYEDVISIIQNDNLLSVLKATVENGVDGQFHDEFVKCLEDLKPKPKSSYAF
jgi:hypothetical protein